jgi:hypothetical protein
MSVTDILVKEDLIEPGYFASGYIGNNQRLERIHKAFVREYGHYAGEVFTQMVGDIRHLDGRDHHDQSNFVLACKELSHYWLWNKDRAAYYNRPDQRVERGLGTIYAKEVFLGSHWYELRDDQKPKYKASLGAAFRHAVDKVLGGPLPPYKPSEYILSWREWGTRTNDIRHP